MSQNEYNGKFKYRIDFKTLGAYSSKCGSKVYSFNDENHFNNWYKKQMGNPKWKIIGYERIYELEKEFSAEDLHQAFLAGKNPNVNSFKDWTDIYFKREIN